MDVNLFNYKEVEADVQQELKYKEEIEKLKKINKELLEQNNKLKSELAMLKDETLSKKHRVFEVWEIEMIKMYSIQRDENGKYPTVRALAKEFDCSVGLMHSIIKGIRSKEKVID